MEGTPLAIFFGAFLVLIGVYIFIHPEFGFKINHFLEKNPRKATPRDLLMMKVSGVVTVVVGAAVLAWAFGFLK